MALVQYNGNIGKFEYENTEYEIIKIVDVGDCLHYIGGGRDIKLPKGCINCRYMFSNTNIELDLSSFKTTGVVDMENIFFNNLSTELDLSGFDLTSVVNMDGMFMSCSNLERVIFPSCFANNVQSIRFMFSNCVRLKTVDFEKLILPNVRFAFGMFVNCKELKAIDLSGLTLKNVEFDTVFSVCFNLCYMKLSNVYIDVDKLAEKCLYKTFSIL